GPVWKKTSIDTHFAGRWHRVDVKIGGTPDATNQEWLFTEKRGAYEVKTFHNGKPDDDGPLYPVKMLVVGPYHFVAGGPKKGTILRYEVKEDAIVFYTPEFGKIWDFIQEHYPDAKDIYREKSNDNDQPFKIKVFDRQVFEILSKIPNDDSYWHTEARL